MREIFWIIYFDGSVVWQLSESNDFLFYSGKSSYAKIFIKYSSRKLEFHLQFFFYLINNLSMENSVKEIHSKNSIKTLQCVKSRILSNSKCVTLKKNPPNKVGRQLFIKWTMSALIRTPFTQWWVVEWLHVDFSWA